MYFAKPNNLLHLTQRSTFLFVHSLALIVAQKSTTTAAQMSKALGIEFTMMKNGVRMENMGEKISAVVASLLLAGCAGQRPLPEDPSLLTPQASVLEFLVDIQERNFR